MSTVHLPAPAVAGHFPVPAVANSPAQPAQPVTEAAALDAAHRWQLRASEASLAEYGRTLCRVERFCATRGLAARPASPSTVGSYLEERRDVDGLQRITLKAEARAIRRGHLACGLPDPTDHPQVRALLGIGRRVRSRPPTAGALLALVHGLSGRAAVPAALRPPEGALPEEAPLSLQEVDAAVQRFKLHSLARGTRQNYARPLKHYGAFCDRHGLSAMPATPLTVCRFLAEYGLERGTPSLNTARCAIRWIHLDANQLSPTDCKQVKDLIEGHARLYGKAPCRKHAFTANEIVKLCKAMDDEGGMHASRDKAMDLLGFTGAFRRSEITCRDTHDDEGLLIYLDLTDLSFNRYGVLIRIRKSKTDQTGECQYVFVTYGTSKETCAVLALRNWIELMKARGITTGPVFRSLCRRGDRLIGDAEILDRPMTPGAFVLRLKHWAKRIGLDAATIGGHSLRAGHVTAASQGGASIFSIARQGRWKDPRTVLIYHRQALAHVDNSSSALGI
jgi:integrase